MSFEDCRALRPARVLKVAALGVAVAVSLSTTAAAQQGNAYGLGRLAAVANLPAGPFNLGIDERTAKPDKQAVYTTIEGTISHFELVMSNRGIEVPCEESYSAIEAPNGELGFYIVGDGSNVAYRARCRPPSSRGWSTMRWTASSPARSCPGPRSRSRARALPSWPERRGGARPPALG